MAPEGKHGLCAATLNRTPPPPPSILNEFNLPAKREFLVWSLIHQEPQCHVNALSSDIAQALDP